MSLPDLKSEIDQSNLVEFAKKLFGEDNILNITSSIITPNPLALFCTKSNRKEFFGDKIANFSNLLFCDNAKYIQADVGICHAHNPVMFLNDDQVTVQPQDSKMIDNLRNAEHLIILCMDKFENPSSFKVYFVKNWKSFPKIHFIFLFRR